MDKPKSALLFVQLFPISVFAAPAISDVKVPYFITQSNSETSGIALIQTTLQGDTSAVRVGTEDSAHVIILMKQDSTTFRVKLADGSNISVTLSKSDTASVQETVRRSLVLGRISQHAQMLNSTDQNSALVSSSIQVIDGSYSFVNKANYPLWITLFAVNGEDMDVIQIQPQSPNPALPENRSKLFDSEILASGDDIRIIVLAVPVTGGDDISGDLSFLLNSGEIHRGGGIMVNPKGSFVKVLSGQRSK